jgi:hypothetical protein
MYIGHPWETLTVYKRYITVKYLVREGAYETRVSYIMPKLPIPNSKRLWSRKYNNDLPGVVHGCHSGTCAHGHYVLLVAVSKL